MFFTPKNDSQIEARIQSNEQKIKELANRMESLNREITNFLKELKITPEQLSQFLANQENFSTEQWEEIQAQRKVLDEKLLLELASLQDPQKLKQKYAERNVNRHWLFVR